MKRVLAYYTAGWVRLGRYLVLGIALAVANFPLYFFVALYERNSSVSHLGGIVIMLAYVLYAPFAFHWASDKTHQLKTPVVMTRPGGMSEVPTPFPSHRTQKEEHHSSS